MDELSNWYVRRSRRRFWKSEADADKIAAYLTLNECLVTLSKLLAPFTPFLAEELYQNLVAERSPEAPESVHLVDWPVADEALIDEDLSFRMAMARQVVNLGRAARNATQIKTRQPVARWPWSPAASSERAAVESLAAVVAEELNVKALEYVELGRASWSATWSSPTTARWGPSSARTCRRWPRPWPRCRPTRPATGSAAGRSVMVTVDGQEYEFAPDDFVVETHQREGYQVEREGGLAVAISTALSPELVSEGLARELVHHIQNTRKAADFQIDDRIHLRVSGPAEIAEMLAVHGDWVKKETLAVSLEVERTTAAAPVHTAASHPPRGRRGAPRRRLPRGAEGQRSAGDRGGRQRPEVPTALRDGAGPPAA